MIRTIIVDDEILSRIGIQSFIEGKEDITVSGVFGMAKDAVEFLRENPVDVVITDIEMSDINGLEFIQMIRENHLAGGVIIVSCHDDFAYAQEAISKGTDSYLLKYNVTQDMLLQEIRKVYEKTRKTVPSYAEEKLYKKPNDMEDGVYRIGVLKLKPGENPAGEGGTQPEGAMLIHLLEGIVNRYEMGTLFAPYNKEIFIIFRFKKESTKEKREEALGLNLSTIAKNTRQYISGSLIYGVSREFTDLKETRLRYEEALSAVAMSFYDGEKTAFYYREAEEGFSLGGFETEAFPEEEGVLSFERELTGVLRRAHFQRVGVDVLKENLIQSVSRMVYQILHSHQLSEGFMDKWNSETLLISAITLANSKESLKENLLSIVRQFAEEMKEELKKDDLSPVFWYIDEHLAEKISLTELADLSCMSVPSFCKKFKDRTGVTLIQYLNEKRIEKAMVFLKNRSYSLWQIAELTGFSNTNYFIRVFKKVTGQTVSEYRRQFGITENG